MSASQMEDLRALEGLVEAAMSTGDYLTAHAAAEERLSKHLCGWKECDLGNDRCEHVQRRDAAYLAYTKQPHVSVR